MGHNYRASRQVPQTGLQLLAQLLARPAQGCSCRAGALLYPVPRLPAGQLRLPAPGQRTAPASARHKLGLTHLDDLPSGDAVHHALI